MRSNRAISTVMDVSIAMLLISASIVVIGLYLTSGTASHNPETADQTVQTLTASTVSVSYSVKAVETDDPAFPYDLEDEAIADDDFNRVSHGPAAGHLADGAVTNVEIDDQQVTAEGEDFEDAVDGAIQGSLVGASHHARVIAVWEPYDGASISGTATAGRSPPPDTDLSSVTLTVPSGTDAIDDDELVTAFKQRPHYEPVAEIIARTIVEQYFPPAATQQTLEQQGVDRAVTVYRYEQFDAALDGEANFRDPSDEYSDLNRINADAVAANDQLVDALVPIIEADLADPDDPELRAEIDTATTQFHNDELTHDEWERAVGRALAAAVSIDEVTLTVQTWDP